MAQQNARELVIKRGASADGTGTITFVCGIRTRSFSMSNATIDNTVPDCDDPSLPIVATAKPGRQTIEFSGDGLFDNDAVSILVADDARLQREPPYTVIVPGYGTWVGPFMVSNFVWSGDMEEQLAFSATWIPTNINLLVFTPETP
jgi:predicted secreted protein